MIDYLREKPETVELLRILSAERLAISIMTYGEVYDGIYAGRDPGRNEDLFLRFLHGVTVLRLTRPIMRRFARIRGELRRQGLLIPDPDLLIHSPG